MNEIIKAVTIGDMDGIGIKLLINLWKFKRNKIGKFILITNYKLFKKYIKKNNIKTKVVGCKIIREKNGLAYSSRNDLLTKSEKKIASKIYKYIKYIKRKIIKKQINLKTIKKNVYNLGVKKIDYIQILDINKIISNNINNTKFRIFVAYYLRSTRIIDNI